MPKSLRRFLPLFSLSVLFLLINSGLIQQAYASPDSATYQSKPTAHTITALTVTDPAKAYDSDNATYAYFTYTATDGSFEVKTFTTLSDPWRITTVDFTMRYKTTASSKDDVYRIVYYVDPSATANVLVDWTRVAKSLYTYVWRGRSEPNDGVWSWTDISKIRFVVEVDRVGGGDTPGDFYEYETWVTVHYRRPTLYVDPTSQTVAGPFTVAINITNMDDLYSWEFNITYDTTKLTATGVTEGPFLKSGGSTQFNKTISDANGWVYAYASLIGDVAGVTGSGDLANITFSIDATGASTLDFNNKTKLIEYDFVTKANYTYFSDKTLCSLPPYYVSDVDGSVTITAVPEFPLGAAMEIALAAIVIYVWWTYRRKTKPQPC